MAEPLYPLPDPVTDASLTPVPQSLSPDAAPGVTAPASPPIHLLREDLNVPWDFVDMVIFIFFSLGMLELASDVAAWFAISYAGVKPEKIMEFATTSAAFIVWRQVAWFALLLAYLYTMVRMRTREPVWRTLGWRGLPRRATTKSSTKFTQTFSFLAAGALLAFCVQFATVFVGTKAKLPIQALLTDRRSILYMMAFGMLVAPFVEETVFRGFLYPIMARRFGVVIAVIFTGTFFGLMHAEQLWGGWGEISLLVAVGIVFTTARAWSGSVTVSYLLHLGYNGLLFLGTYVATDGLRHF
jgi:membrane protease YdiL (CAAX protease family)